MIDIVVKLLLEKHVLASSLIRSLSKLSVTLSTSQNTGVSGSKVSYS